MITVVVGKEIEKIKGDFESYLNGLNMVGEISYSQYSKLYDEGTKQMQRAYELGKSELEKENAELKKQIEKMKCCHNCSFSYCKTSSEHIDKDGNIIFHCWNIEKRTYCDVGKNGKYQCWQLRN